MKIILAALNAKFIHSCLAVRAIQAYAHKEGIQADLMEFTINHQQDYIIQELFEEQPDLLGFSCYIWNIEIIKNLIRVLKRVLPNTIILLGGPEVSYDSKNILRECPADIVIKGEGELTFSALCTAILNKSSIENVAGITFRSDLRIIENPPRPLANLDDIPFPYDNLNDLDNRIIYYESSRGCPYSCGYCLSSAEQGVKFLSLKRVYSDLSFFLENNVRQVKFVDRTFNCDKRRTMSIWRFLAENDNGITNFHFEINADNLDFEAVSFLQTVRKGLFQFEIGIQTTNENTLKEISRKNNMKKISRIVQGLEKNKNIHLHLDLIAGLPGENFDSFGRSFDRVYSLKPNQLQVGFLKVLKGTDMHIRSSKLGLVSSDQAPYEILYTPHLSFADVLELKKIENMVEQYYNSNRFKLTIEYLAHFFPTPSIFFKELAEFYYSNDYHKTNHSKEFGYTVLYELMQEKYFGDPARFKWIAKYDMYSHEKARRLPEWLDADLSRSRKADIYGFFNIDENIEKYLPQYSGLDGKQIARMAHLEFFPFEPESGEQRQCAVLFNYRKADLLGNAETTTIFDF